jgi:hypothetical protein
VVDLLLRIDLSAAGIRTGSVGAMSSLVTLMILSWCPVFREYRRPDR